MSHTADTQFGWFRSFLWPIHRHEYRKFIPMLVMVFFVCFNYSVLRCLKDSLVITASDAGAAAIPFIKLWAILPAALVITLVFTKLSNRFSQEKVFYIFVTGFIIAFFLFAFVFHPYRHALHPIWAIEPLEEMLPMGFKGLIAMCCNWIFTGFYVLCELWGSMVMSVLFWGFANEVTRIGEARRFYSVFMIWANLAAIAAGQTANYFSYGDNFNPNFPFGSSAWEQTVTVLVMIVILAGLVIMAAFRWLNKNGLNDPTIAGLHKTKREVKKQKLSMRDSFSFLSNSKYLACIAIIVVGYNLTINLAEVVWKDQLRELYPSANDYQTYLNNLTSATGVISTIVALFMGRILGTIGWTRTALITPIIMIVTCVGFFTFMIFQESLSPIAIGLTGMTPLVICIFFGAAQNCLSKAMKYSVFDTTKEMTFIPLDHDTKLKGKAAIDGVGSRLGKSGGAIIHQSLLVIFFTLPECAPYLAGIILLAIGGWIVAVRSLGVQFAEITAPSLTEEPAEGEELVGDGKLAEA